MTLARTASRRATATLAAYVLVLQALLAGLGAGLAAGATLAGTPELCRGAGTGVPDGTADHAAKACCLIGCAGAGPLFGPPPPAFAFAVPAMPHVAASGEDRAAPLHDTLRSGHRARAPPA